MAARFGLAVLALCVLLAGAARAQIYQRLHVRAFTLTSDTPSPALERPFHVTLTIRVAESVSTLDNVFLPTFFGAEELGDVQETAHGSGGTTYRETLTLVAHARGMLSISPAYLDAIDSRDGKPKRFLSNSLRLPVGGGPVTALWSVLRTIALVAIDLLLLALAAFVAAAIVWRRRAASTNTVAPVQPPVPAPVNSKDEIEDAFERLRERRDRASVLQLRAALWRLAGGNAGETLSDVLGHPAARDGQLRRLLTIVERAAFVEEARLEAAIEEVLCSPQY